MTLLNSGWFSIDKKDALIKFFSYLKFKIKVTANDGTIVEKEIVPRHSPTKCVS